MEARRNIEIHGRLDHQVKVRGFRIELGKLKRRLSNTQRYGTPLSSCRRMILVTNNWWVMSWQNGSLLQLLMNLEIF